MSGRIESHYVSSGILRARYETTDAHGDMWCTTEDLMRMGCLINREMYILYTTLHYGISKSAVLLSSSGTGSGDCVLAWSAIFTACNLNSTDCSV
jgi:hypothetical protein